MHAHPTGSASRPAALLALALLPACAHAPDRDVTRVDSDWIRPRLEEAARAMVGCVRGEPERVVEVELTREGQTRGHVYPYPPAPEQQACADRIAATVPLQPSHDVVRSVVRADGQPIDATGARASALALRSRASEQVAAVDDCRRAWLQRGGRAPGRVGLLITVDAEGGVTSAESPASSLDAAADACAIGATRALRLPPIPGRYAFSYLLGADATRVGAPDVDPIDAHALALAVAAQRRAIDGCVATYRTPGRLLVRIRFGNDGVPADVKIERETGGGQQDEADVRADACMRRAAGGLRVIPFDGPPAEQTLPFSLR